MVTQLAIVLSVLISAGSLLYTHASNRRKADSEQVGRLFGRIDAIEERVTKREADVRHLPDKDATHELKVSILEMKAEIAVLGERMKPVAAVSERLQDFLLERETRA